MQSKAFSYFAARADPRWETVTTPAQFASMMSTLEQQRTVAVDFETSGLAWWKQARACGLAFTCDAGDLRGTRNWYVPFRHYTGEQQLPYDLVAPGFKRILESEAITKIAHNIKFEHHIASREGWSIRGPRHDTMVLARLFDENQPAGLKHRGLVDLGDMEAHLYEELLGREIARLAKADGVGKEAYLDQWGYSRLPIFLCGTYAGKDTDLTWRLFQKYGASGVVSAYPRIYPTEMALTEILYEMEEEGMPIDVPYLQQLHTTLREAQAKTEGEIWASLGSHNRFDLRSDDELRVFMQRDLKLVLEKRTKKDTEFSVDAEVLESFAAEQPVLSLVLNWREAEKIASTYTVTLLDRLDADGILHGDFQQLGTNTGRLSCQKPNLQNISSDSDARAKAATGKKLAEGGVDPWSVHRAFTVQRSNREESARWCRVFADYSQIELRVLAFYTADPVLREAYALGQDIHTRTSLEVFGTDDPAQRRMAKIINFGLCIAGGQPVLTSRGLVSIEQVHKEDLLWDGAEWVKHDGLVCRGEQEVIEYAGLWATPDHQVFTETGEKMPIARAQEAGRPLATGEVAGVPVGYAAFDRLHRAAGYAGFEILRGHLCGLREGPLVALLQRDSWVLDQLPLSEGEVQGPACAYAWGAVRLYGAALHARYTRLLEELQRAWDQSPFSLAGALCSVGVGEVPRNGLQGAGLRPEGQRWPLRARQPSTCGPEHQLESPPQAGWGLLQGWSSAFGRQPLPQDSKGRWTAACLPDVHAELRADVSRPSPRRAVVYDLINAGPRHRFTVAGKIVSNSYGLSAQGFSRQTGVPLEEAEGHYRRFETQYAGITSFRTKFWNYVRANGCKFSNLFGRPRRIPEMASERYWERGRAERRAIGTLIQGTAAELTKESIVRLRNVFRAKGMQARIVCTIHDEIQIDAPVAEFAEVARLTKLQMENFPEFAPVPIVVDLKATTKNWMLKRGVKL